MKRLRIVRDGIPHYVAPWFNDLSPATRKIMGRQGRLSCDPQAQLGLPIPDMDSGEQSVLDFGFKASEPKPGKPAPSFYIIPAEAFSDLTDLQRQLYRDGNKHEAQSLWNALATVKRADQ